MLGTGFAKDWVSQTPLQICCFWDVRPIIANSFVTGNFKMAQQPGFTIAKACEIILIMNHCCIIYGKLFAILQQKKRLIGLTLILPTKSLAGRRQNLN